MKWSLIIGETVLLGISGNIKKMQGLGKLGQRIEKDFIIPQQSHVGFSEGC